MAGLTGRNPIPPETPERRARFDSHTEVTSDGCIEWTGSRTRWGYGQLSMRGGGGSGVFQAHRVALAWATGEQPLGMVADHLCRNRACVNPEHLEWVTDRVNILRGNGATAQHARKTHCPQGHPYSDENTYRFAAGRRICKECARARSRRYSQRKREAAAA